MSRAKAVVRRPRKPNYASMVAVMNAIHLCSCGKFRGGTLNDLMRGLDCGCVGPKSWTQLLALTKLHPNTLSRTCSFLVEKKVLTRTVLKERGHHVRYSINDTYWENYSLRIEIELSAKERRESRRINTEISKRLREIHRFRRYYQSSINLLEAELPKFGKLPFLWAMYLAKLVHILGLDEGTSRFIDKYDELGRSAFMKFAAAATIGKGKLV